MDYSLTMEELDVLRKIIKTELQAIYSHTLNYNLKENTYEIFETVVLSMEKGFILLKSQECEINHDEYYQVSIEESISPGQLPYDKRAFNSGMFQEPISHVLVWEKVESVSLYQRALKSHPEELTYTAGIKIEFSSKKSLYFKPYFIGFSFTFDQQLIEKETSQLTLYKVIK
ncbi:hypothetical protein [Fictibacillus sp. UD]|uniref:hypothetical protein n=1 Tax=Fictibacillus sp. UD TaxID=3038777 RepID=UPI003749579F